MHIVDRLFTVLILSLVSVPLVTFAFVAGDTGRTQTEQELQEALEDVRAGQIRRNQINAHQERTESLIDETKKQLPAIAKKKRKVRLELAALIKKISQTQHEGDTLLMDQNHTERLYVRERERFGTFVALLHARHLTLDAGPVVVGIVFRKLLGNSLGERIEQDLLQRVLTKTRRELMFQMVAARDTSALSSERLHASAGDMAKQLFALREEHQKLQKEYMKMLVTIDRAQMTIALSQEELQAVREEDEEVHEQVLKMQGELERIDARLRRRTERELIEKGLRAPRPGEHSDGDLPGGTAIFDWPVKGVITAGFADSAYRKYFGVLHRAIDIRAAQGTTVRSSADGVVLLVRPGGAKGYTYVLIGHRGGYSTLYGHLLEVYVQHGEDVNQGQAIGRSGGMPGTPGAGRMTTGPHLHFEMHVNGQHIDPRTMLP